MTPSRRPAAGPLLIAAMVTAVLAAWVAPVGSSHATVNLIRNGGFEQPAVGASYQLFTPGQAFPGWSVVGPSGSNVAVISGAFAQNGFNFTAQAGKQDMDLTGTSDLINRNLAGVAQTVKTVTGARYTLRFSVGNVVNPGGVFGTTSTVELQINDRRVLLARNALGKGSTRTAWKTFTYAFKATSATTKVAFLNYDLASDTANGLDSVSLSRG